MVAGSTKEALFMLPAKAPTCCVHRICSGLQSANPSPMVTNMLVSTARGTVGRPGQTSAARLVKNRCAVAVSLTRGMGASTGRRRRAGVLHYVGGGAISERKVWVRAVVGRPACSTVVTVRRP